MDVSTFLKRVAPEPVSEQESSATPWLGSKAPNGTLIEYRVKPRGYKVNDVEVPSVTTVLDSLNKPGLKWWGMKVGVEGVLELFNRFKLGTTIDWNDNRQYIVLLEPKVLQDLANAENIVKLLTQEKLTVNHVLDKAGVRGINVHDALEQWAKSGGEFFPTPQNYPEEERGYVEGLLKWVENESAFLPERFEVMVGSTEHGFAGRYDLVITINEPATFIQKKYKRKADIEIEVAPGRYLVDLKTSKGVYPESHFRQLAAYELASVECGYPKTDGQFVLHVTADGNYEFVPSTAKAEDFLAVLEVYKSNGRLK
jgi:hypothetical protein